MSEGGRVIWSLVVWVIEGDPSFTWCTPEHFEERVGNMIDAGFSNLRTEWYVRGKPGLPDRVQVFAYWEDEWSVPTFEQLEAWGQLRPESEDEIEG